MSNSPEAPRRPDPRLPTDWARALREAGPLLGIGTTLAVTVALGVLLGHAADERWGTTPAFTLVGAFAGIGIALYGFIRTATKKP